MTIRENSIVVRRDSDGHTEGTNYRVVKVDGRNVTLRNLSTYMLSTEDEDALVIRYHVDPFEPGDIVRVRKEYANQYSETEGYNDLTVVRQSSSAKAPTTRVRDIDGDEFTILTERINLVRPALAFKAGDRVVIDHARMKKFGGDGIEYYWQDAGVMVLTEDSGSRAVQSTSHVRYENKDEKDTNNVPTRWLKLYVEPPKRVVGQTIKAEDLKVGDKISVSQTLAGIHHVMTGIVGDRETNWSGGSPTIVSSGGGVFAYESRGAVYTLLEEAPEPVDENLQRLLDAEVGDLVCGTYAGEYWKKTDEDEWYRLNAGGYGTTEEVFDSLFKVKYGKLEFFERVEDAD